MLEKICLSCAGSGWRTRFNSLFMPYKDKCRSCNGKGFIKGEDVISQLNAQEDKE